LEVLNPHFQHLFQISKAKAAFVQVAVYGGYFLMAIPAGLIIRKWGYRVGVITGLLLYGIGALLFIPGSQISSFWFFVFSLFIIGCGLTCLETSANPYTTVLGDPSRAETRINLSQSFNGLGWIVGPLIGGSLLFSGVSVSVPYAMIGILVLIVALVFTKVKLPEINEENDEEEASSAEGSLWNLPFLMGATALFLYVAAQTGVNSFFINYMTENAAISASEASLWLGFGGMGLFVFGRLTGGLLMNRFSPRRLLFAYSLFATLATLVIVYASGREAMGAFLVVYLCESIMFPTIFSLALRDAKGKKKMASAVLIMTIVGGAISPVLMGLVADRSGSMSLAFTVPLVCYMFIVVYCLTVKH